MLSDRVADVTLPWAIGASCSLALHGLDVDPHDIDLDTTAAGAYRIEHQCRDLLARPVQFVPSPQIRSHWGALAIDGIQVELIGDFQVLRGDGSWAPPPDVRQLRQQLRQFVATAGRMAEALENWLANPVFVPARERPGVAARLQEMVSDYTWWRARYPGLRRGLQPPAAGHLHEISAPTLVIVGERDLPVVQAASTALATGIRGARLVVLPGVGHMSNMEDPEAFNSAVLSFLAEL
jgi:pimeloyl-ACP methyl ester carboxylesterase